MIKIDAVPAYSDNYIWLIQFGEHQAVVVDPGQATQIIQILDENELHLAAVLVTHKHWDHVNGIATLLDYHPAPVYGPAGESIPRLSHPCTEGDHIAIGALNLTVLDVPGHTGGHIAFYGHDTLFCGDTLFAAGCGRLLGGTAAQLHDSLKKISQLPISTHVCCAHEYTLANLKFAREVEPGNSQIRQRYAMEEQKRRHGTATLPSTLKLELETNPFLRCHVDEVIASAERFASKSLTSEADVFKTLRYWKDTFS